MKLPRLTIGRMMGLVVLVSLPLGLLAGELSGHSLSPYRGTSLALWPTLTAFGFATFRIIGDRGKCSLFLLIFAVVGWASVAVYVVICRWFPQVVAVVALYYINDLTYWWIVWFIDLQDDYFGYVANLFAIGLILAAPQLMMAILGGLIAKWFWGKRWTTT